MRCDRAQEQPGQASTVEYARTRPREAALIIAKAVNSFWYMHNLTGAGMLGPCWVQERAYNKY